MARYPFIVARNKMVIVEADRVSNAIDRVLALHPNKFVSTKYARNVQKHLTNTYMDLISAQVEAAKLSKTKRKELVYIVLVEDEFKVTTEVDIDKDDIYSTWRAGVKIEEPHADKQAEAKEAKASKQTKNETTEQMETKTKTAKKSAKKAAKKVAKKSAVKKVSNGVKRAFEPGKVVNISIADMRKNLKKGYLYRDPQGVIQTEKYMATRAKQDHVRTGMHEYKPAK